MFMVRKIKPNVCALRRTIYSHSVRVRSCGKLYMIRLLLVIEFSFKIKCFGC